MAILLAPARASSVFWAGAEYKVVKGRVTLPEAALADLAAHGFSLVADAPAEAIKS